MPLNIGDRFGDFKITKLSTFSSGFADIGFSVDTNSGEEVVVKVLKEGAPPATKALFEQEGAILQAITGPHIVQLITADTASERPYLVLEKLGKQLFDSIPFAGHNADFAVASVMQAADALRTLHDAGFIHHDVTSYNLLEAGKGTLKLIDYGIAHRIGNGEIKPKIGQKSFVAPEVWAGYRADLRSDLFSLGGLLFQLLTGKTPYKAGEEPDQRTEKRPLNMFIDEMTAAKYQPVIDRLLTPKPDGRYRNVDDVIAALSNV